MAALVHTQPSWDPFNTSDIFLMAAQQSQYPESDIRSIAYTKPSTSSISPSQIPSTSGSSSHHIQSPTFAVVCCRYPTTVPRLEELKPGVWLDGTRIVYSAEWPPVQEFLHQAKRDMQLPSSPSDLVFTLAALNVFYELSNPVHWMFWNDKKKDQTAAIVNRIALQQPPLIRSRVKWNGSREYVWLLDLLHGTGSHPLYEHKEWYPLLGNHKPETPQRALRKRKPKTDREDPSAALDEDTPVERESRPKRHKASHNNNASSTSDLSKPNPLKSEALSPASSTLSIGDMSSLSPLSTLLDDISPEPPATSEETSRPKRASNRKPRQRRTPDISTPLPICETSPNTLSSSALLTPATSSQSRDRSGSQSTLVNGRRSRARSASVLSAITAVDSLTQLEDACHDKAVKPEPGAADAGVQVEEEVGMVTRWRATKAKVSAPPVEPPRAAKRARKKAPLDQ